MNKKKLIILISIIIALAVLVCVGIFALSGGKGKKIADKLDMGEKYLQELEYEKALAMYKEILAIDPKNVDAYLGIVDTYMAMGDYENALKYAEEGYEETNDQVFVGKIEECKAASGAGGQDAQDSQEPQNSVGDEIVEEIPVATPEPDVLLAGTKELEIVVPEAMEVANGNGGVIITYKDGKYGATNYAGEEIVPNIYSDIYEMPNDEGYFALAHRIEVDEYTTEYEVYILNALGRTELVIMHLDRLVICKDKVYFNTAQFTDNETLLCTVQLYDMANDKYLYHSGERERDWEGMSIAVSGDDTFYFTDSWKGYRLELNGTDDATAVQVEGLSYLTELSNFSEGYAWDIYPIYSEFTLVSENGQDKTNCLDLLDSNSIVDYYDNGVRKVGKGKMIVMRGRGDGKFYLMDISYATSVENSMYANVENVIVGSYDYIRLSDSPYYLAGNGNLYFYVDGTGQIVNDSFVDCTDFYGGYAMVVDTDGCAYMIDEQFNKVAGGYPAESVSLMGGVFCVNTPDGAVYLKQPTP